MQTYIYTHKQSIFSVFGRKAPFIIANFAAQVYTLDSNPTHSASFAPCRSGHPPAEASRVRVAWKVARWLPMACVLQAHSCLCVASTQLCKSSLCIKSSCCLSPTLMHLFSTIVLVRAVAFNQYRRQRIASVWESKQEKSLMTDSGSLGTIHPTLNTQKYSKSMVKCLQVPS